MYSIYSTPGGDMYAIHQSGQNRDTPFTFSSETSASPVGSNEGRNEASFPQKSGYETLINN